MARAKIFAITYGVGRVRPIDDLLGDQVDALAIRSLRRRGLENFCVDKRSISEMCTSVARDSLNKAHLDASSIDAVVYAGSNPEWEIEDESRFLNAFYEAGFSSARFIGLTMQGCSGSATALRIGSDFIHDGREIENVLVILAGRTRDGKSRLGAHGSTVFSDGAASCVISAEGGSLEFVASASLTNVSLVQSTDLQQHFLSGMASLEKASQSVLSAGGIGSHEVTALFGMNGSSVYLDLMAEATGIAPDRVVRGDLPRYGHVYSCDNLIGLKNYLDEKGASHGDYYLLCSWSQYVCGAVLLRYL